MIGMGNMDSFQKAAGGEDLSEEEAGQALRQMIDGSMSQLKAAALLVALKMKGESEGEIAAFAKEMREQAVRIHPRIRQLVDTCGTGGDCKGTFNISTASAFIAAGAGVGIAKHGNRSVSSSCGSFDVLEQLGVRALEPKDVERCIEKTGMGFMFAPFFHPAMKNIMPVRKELGIRTIFNLLGPLTNPAGAQAQLIGVYDPRLTEKFASVLKRLGTGRALVVHSQGMDELGLGSSRVSELDDGEIRTYEIHGKDFGFEDRAIPVVKNREESAKIILGVLRGEKGSALDVCLLNAGAAIYVGGKAKTMEEGVGLARKAVLSGAAMKKLDMVREFGG